jgi:L-asparaginase/Glu-tRNA(Gln) amidotransferase subunit D
MDESIEGLRPLPRIEVIYGGGTISSLATPDGHREGGHEVDLVALLQDEIPYYQAPYEVSKKTMAFKGLSENMNEQIWGDFNVAVVDAMDRGADGIVLTHGTDSMEQTAQHLQRTFIDELVRTGRKIVLTGANEDIEHPATDAWENLKLALEASASADIPPGVYVAFHGKIISADEVVKLPYVHKGDSTFVSKNDPRYIQKQAERTARDKMLVEGVNNAFGKRPDQFPAVLFEANVIGADQDKLLRYLDTYPSPAVLMRLYHSGTANTVDEDASVATLIAKLRERGIVSFGVTENGEPVDLHSYETSVQLREAGLVPLYDMTERVALQKLRLIGKKPVTEIIDEMLVSRAGEIDPARIIPEDVAKLKELYATAA